VKKLLIITLPVILLVTLIATPCLAGKSVWTNLDYNGDGVADCQYQTSEKHTKSGWSVNVVYFGFDWKYLGQELWTDYWGLMVDTFEPWTYPMLS